MTYSVTARQGAARYWVRIAHEYIHPADQLRHVANAKACSVWETQEEAQSVANEAARLRPGWSYEPVEN